MRGLGAALVAVALAACTGVTDSSAIAALDFTGIPAPGVVTGDSLRDSLGVAAPLRATAYDGNGNEAVGAPIAYFSLDTGVVVHPDGHLVATRRDGSVRVIASVSGLQSPIRTIVVTREPDSLVAPADTIVSFPFAIPDAPSNVSPALTLTLTTDDTVGVGAAVPGWVVRWRLIHAGDTLAVTDTSKFALWDLSATRHSLRDTTGTDGTSSRRLRAYANVLPLQPDSVIVIAEVRRLGAHVPGSPLRFVVNLTPPGP